MASQKPMICGIFLLTSVLAGSIFVVMPFNKRGLMPRLLIVKESTMNRLIFGLAVSALLLGQVEHARADLSLSIVTDPAAFASNDTAPWVRSAGNSASYNTSSGMGTFTWSFTALSTPDNGTNNVVRTLGGGLFVGQFSDGTGPASYVVNASFNFGGQAVTGLGFLFLGVTPATQLTIYDVQGDSQTITLDTSAGGFLNPGEFGGQGFVGITSNVPLTGFQFSETVTGATTTLNVGQVSFQVVPEPSTVALALSTLPFGGGVWLRRRRRVAA